MPSLRSRASACILNSFAFCAAPAPKSGGAPPAAAATAAAAEVRRATAAALTTATAAAAATTTAAAGDLELLEDRAGHPVGFADAEPRERDAASRHRLRLADLPKPVRRPRLGIGPPQLLCRLELGADLALQVDDVHLPAGLQLAQHVRREVLDALDGLRADHARRNRVHLFNGTRLAQFPLERSEVLAAVEVLEALRLRLREADVDLFDGWAQWSRRTAPA